jgi:hypothetical protein
VTVAWNNDKVDILDAPKSHPEFAYIADHVLLWTATFTRCSCFNRSMDAVI